jgi:protein involved in polysaccharide export with SLBB domain
MFKPASPHPARAAAPLRLCLLLAALAAWVAPAAAQGLPGQARDTTPAAPIATNPVVVAPAQPGSTDTTQLGGRGPLLDAPVSRAEYQLGPGDRLEISVFGEFNRIFAVAVSPEGSVVLPGIGIVRLLGSNLIQAEDRVRQAAARYYRNVDVRLTLSQVRSFKVFVVGNVNAPGVRTASAATRVSEVVGATAGAGAPGRWRNITLRRNNGDSISVDLIRFVQTGDVSANPLLREGDAVVVPTPDARVTVYGRVHYPGIYEYRPRESLAELLSVANGGGDFPANAARTVRVVRVLDAQRRTEISFTREEALGPRGRGFILEPFDGIYVSALANFKEQHTAAIVGQVQRPGTYPIRPDTTTVRELVEMAGGFTPEASLVDATLRREPAPPGRDELSTIPIDMMSTQERRITQVRSSTDPGNVVIDFTRLDTPGSPAYGQTLRNGDLVTVPVRRGEVTILGAVRNPGMIAYNAGNTVQQYLTAAGGLTRRADLRHAVLLRGRTGARLNLWEAGTVEPGDNVIVPFREERSALATIQLITAIASTITGTVLAAVAVLK